MDDIQYNLTVLLLHNMNPEWIEGEQSKSERDVLTLVNDLNESDYPVFNK